MINKRSIGILCPLFSLPNEYGIGDFSECAFKFIDFLSSINYSTWQILPLNPVDEYNSPYSTISSNALDDIYVSLTDLKDRGLINEIDIYEKSVKKVNYSRVRKYKSFYLGIAYKNFINNSNYKNILEDFIKREPWVIDYAHYVTLRKANGNVVWNKWNKTFIDDDDKTSVEIEIFKQYILYEQWDKIHRYAKEKNINIMGDLPFYVGYDSVDVYKNKRSFLIDETNTSIKVAGVPPDYYSATGQMWGNPIYDWEYLKRNNFSFIIDRIIHSSKIYDLVRLDHFRAFDTYYMIPSYASDARIGEWKEAPGYDFFNALFTKDKELNLIAEDLGEMRENVFYLRDHFNLPGMQVIQFTFLDEEIRHQNFPFVFKRNNSVIYLSTHDSATVLEWFNSLDDYNKNAISNFLEIKYGKHPILSNLFTYTLSQPASLAILSISDILGLNKSGRINTPGVKSKNNWIFRFKDFSYLEKKRSKLISIAKKSNRI